MTTPKKDSNLYILSEKREVAGFESKKRRVREKEKEEIEEREGLVFIQEIDLLDPWSVYYET